MFDEKERSLPHVNVPLLAIVFSILILLWYFCLRTAPHVLAASMKTGQVVGGAPGTPAQDYLNYAGWFQAQYNANGANVGYKAGSLDW